MRTVADRWREPATSRATVDVSIPSNTGSGNTTPGDDMAAVADRWRDSVLPPRAGRR